MSGAASLPIPMGWRWAFIIMGIPGIFIALLVFLTLREPSRGAVEGDVTEEVPSLSDVARRCFSNPTFRHAMMGGMLGGFGLHMGWGSSRVCIWNRVHELPLNVAGPLYGPQTFASVGLGLLIGGSLASRLGQRNLRWYSLIPAIGMFTCCADLSRGVPGRPRSLRSSSSSSRRAPAWCFTTAPGMAIVQNPATPQHSGVDDGAVTCSSNLVSMGSASRSSDS